MEQNQIPSQKKTVRFSKDESEPMSTPTDKKKISFWSENPNILLDKDTMLEFFPMDTMGFNQKLNAITRSILLLTIVSLFFVRNIPRVLFLCVLSLAGIWGMYKYYTPHEGMSNEGMNVGETYGTLDESSINHFSKTDTTPLANSYQHPSPENPFSNVLVSDYDDNPQKLAAPPASNPMINDMITQNTVQFIQNSNPDQPNISDKLFHDINEQLSFEQSLRPFHSNPSTTIPNDQGAFAEFCYGNMISCKEGNMFACGRNTSHYNNY